MQTKRICKQWAVFLHQPWCHGFVFVHLIQFKLQLHRHAVVNHCTTNTKFIYNLIMLEGGGRGSTTTSIISRISYEAFCDLYESVPEYLAHIEELMPWHDRINVMCKSFHQFCVANRKHFPATSFATCPNIGTYGVDIKIVAAFLSWLRFKTHGTASKQIRKVSTIHHLWQQTRSGLRAALATTTHKPDWLSCLTSHAHGKFV